MARTQPGTAKFQLKQLKASGLQRLRYYCQICQKQCRDANGFKNHLSLPSHTGRIENLSKDGKGHSVVNQFLADFERDFLRLLRINHGTKKINANKFYQEYILHDRDHVHMNATRWSSLTSFVKHLGQTGKVRVESADSDEEFNLVIRLVDALKPDFKPKTDMGRSEEEEQERFLQKQVELGKKMAEEAKLEPQNVTPPAPRKEETGPVKLSLKGFKKQIRKPAAFGDDDDEDDD